MMIILIVLILLVLLCGGYLLAVRGRRNHSGLNTLQGWSYAHRGLHGDGIPENSMAAFRSALENGYGIELDVHLLKDGNLAVIHDASLKRTAGADIFITELTTEDLANYHLEGTEETIPTFRQVLDLYAGKAPLIIELKADGNNQSQLVDVTCKMMESYEGAYCMESFDPRCVYFLKKNHPEIIRGQLTENYFASKSKLPWILKWALKHQVLNCVTVPDFVAYRFADRKTISNTLVRKIWGVQGVTWTLKTQEEYDAAAEEGWLPIFEGFRP